MDFAEWMDLPEIFQVSVEMNEIVQLLWKIKIHSTSNKYPYIFHTMNFQFFSSAGRHGKKSKHKSERIPGILA